MTSYKFRCGKKYTNTEYTLIPVCLRSHRQAAHNVVSCSHIALFESLLEMQTLWSYLGHLTQYLHCIKDSDMNHLNIKALESL